MCRWAGELLPILGAAPTQFEGLQSVGKARLRRPSASGQSQDHQKNNFMSGYHFYLFRELFPFSLIVSFCHDCPDVGTIQQIVQPAAQLSGRPDNSAEPGTPGNGTVYLWLLNLPPFSTRTRASRSRRSRTCVLDASVGDCHLFI